MKMDIIRNKMGKKAVAALMSVMIMSAPVTSVSFASEEPAGGDVAAQTVTEQAVDTAEAKSSASVKPAAAPEKPIAASHKDNSKVEAYNKEVDNYNESARQYNESVDKEYNTAVEEANRMNEEIDQHNAAEQQRVKDAEERNAQAQNAADEANKKIDEENAMEKESVEQHNKNEAEKEQAAKDAIEAAEKQNKESEEHNAKVDKYNADMEQYKADLAQYEYDKKIEAQILGRGYSSVEQYNAAIDRAYNAPAKKSVEKNAAAKEVSVKDTYTLQEAAVKSGVKVTVHIEHNFQDIDLSYSEDFEIDANDIITVNPICAIGEQTTPGYATFYYNTDDQHQMGYWMEAYSSVGSNAKYNNYGWNCGDTHEISYKDGKNHKSDKEEIVVEYNYMWNPLKVYKTYNTPVEPAAPENPGEARAMVDVPEMYTPEYKTFVEKEHVIAELEEIAEADIWEKVPNPVKKAYIDLLDYMTLFDVPEAVEAADPADIEAPEAPAAPAEKAEVADPAETAAVSTASKVEVKAKNAALAAASVTIANDAMPLAANAEEVSDNAVPMTIMDSETPQAPAGAWALINLLSALATALLSLIMMVGIFRTRREEDEETSELEERNRKVSLRLASLIPAIGAIAAFLLTENMANPMILTDRWTVMMIVILAIQTGVALLVGKKANDNEEELGNA